MSHTDRAPSGGRAQDTLFQLRPKTSHNQHMKHLGVLSGGERTLFKFVEYMLTNETAYVFFPEKT